MSVMITPVTLTLSVRTRTPALCVDVWTGLMEMDFSVLVCLLHSTELCNWIFSIYGIEMASQSSVKDGGLS